MALRLLILLEWIRECWAFFSTQLLAISSWYKGVCGYVPLNRSIVLDIWEIGDSFIQCMITCLYFSMDVIFQYKCIYYVFICHNKCDFYSWNNMWNYDVMMLHCYWEFQSIECHNWAWKYNWNYGSYTWNLIHDFPWF